MILEEGNKQHYWLYFTTAFLAYSFQRILHSCILSVQVVLQGPMVWNNHDNYYRIDYVALAGVPSTSHTLSSSCCHPSNSSLREVSLPISPNHIEVGDWEKAALALQVCSKSVLVTTGDALLMLSLATSLNPTVPRNGFLPKAFLISCSRYRTIHHVEQTGNKRETNRKGSWNLILAQDCANAQISSLP